MRKKFSIVGAVAMTSLLLAGCGGPGATGNGPGGFADDDQMKIGVSLPTQQEERWITDGKALKEGLTSLGYEVDLQYANYDTPTQQEQVDQMLSQGADLLILAPIDGTALAPQLQAAESSSIPIISYERMIRDNPDVDLYVTFDNFKVGAQQATSLLVGLGIIDKDGTESTTKGPFNIELFAGSLDDNNASVYFSGAMSILQPYIDDGTLVVKSGQTDIAQITIEGWDAGKAQQRMDDLLTSTYSDGSTLDAVLTPNDNTARGVITALKNAGYGPKINSQDMPMPITSGQDAEIASIKLINDEVQFSTVFKDTRELAAQAVEGADALLNGRAPEINDNESYDNGAVLLPTYLVPIEAVYKDNLTELVIDSGYYTEEQVKAGRLG